MFENKSFSEESTILKAIQDARAWTAAQMALETPIVPHSVVPCANIFPVANSFTWSSYSDAAWDSTTGNCGLGWQLRDTTDVVSESSFSHRRCVPSALVAEALAVKAAVSAALSSRVSLLHVFSDSKNLIMLLKSQDQHVVLKGILHDIRVMALSFDSILYFSFRV